MELPQEEYVEIKMSLVAIQKDIESIQKDLAAQKKTLGYFIGEGFKMVSAIVTAYLLLKFGLA